MYVKAIDSSDRNSRFPSLILLLLKLTVMNLQVSVEIIYSIFFSQHSSYIFSSALCLKNIAIRATNRQTCSLLITHCKPTDHGKGYFL
jgi:hypothetical protein